MPEKWNVPKEWFDFSHKFHMHPVAHMTPVKPTANDHTPEHPHIDCLGCWEAWRASYAVNETTVTEMQDRVIAWARGKGWCDRVVEIPEQCALIHSEISEALEAWRTNEPLSWTDESGKPQGVMSEYADAVIRILHYSALLGGDLYTELIRKMDYNDTRAFKHGGKKG